MTAEELKQRRQVVDCAISTHTREGISFYSKTLKILEEYAKGAISFEEFNTLMDNTKL
ncbi:antitoxin VbhA family protein [Bartonella krasnovii]|nr:antitoxin VbhA family protein [Bartonella krasnovii]UNF28734.1 antitoxin VbhA family protein [Bartonella krasnovii]UNF35110.1 antitoxin VbhA family protein [Bartonella krasnovii]UNF41724.1 antitoxin VbhA family protein [Bartonella krasnovii]UNF54929.1 antitoxin VbhA family protein [Bartonella krasnovii]